MNELDPFPDAAAVSLDSDGDGAPDAWNPGKGPADSTSGLVALDDVGLTAHPRGS